MSKVMMENTYAAYLLIREYFKECSFKNPNLKTTLKIYFKELNDGKRKKTMKSLSPVVEKALAGYREVLGLMVSEISFKRDEEGNHLSFVTGFERVELLVNERGYCEIKIVNKC